MSSFALLWILWKEFSNWSERTQLRIRRDPIFGLGDLAGCIKDLAGCFEAGWMPPEKTFDRLRHQQPWGNLVADLVVQLRERGAAVLPTLNRFCELSMHQWALAKESKSKCAQTEFQANVGIALVGIQSFCLFKWLPGTQTRPWIWAGVAGVALGLAWVARQWIQKLAREARHGGMGGESRNDYLLFLGAYERWLALVQSGLPTDHSWTDAYRWLQTMGASSHLVGAWCSDLWEEPKQPTSLVYRFPHRIRRAVHLSHVEGRPSVDRAQTSYDACVLDYQQVVHSRVQSLPARSILPLGLLMAPACLGQLGAGLVLEFIHTSHDGLIFF